MAYHPFERVVSLWLQRVKGFYVLENYPIRYDREKTGKYSPGTATTDLDLVYLDSKNPDVINIVECKSNINETFHNNSRDRLLKQLDEEKELVKKLPFYEKRMKVRQHVFGIKIAERIKGKLPKDVNVVEGFTFKETVIDELILHVGKDCKIDPKDDVLSIIRLFWHYGTLKEDYYTIIAKQIISKNPSISADNLRKELGLIRDLTPFCKELKAKVVSGKI